MTRSLSVFTAYAFVRALKSGRLSLQFCCDRYHDNAKKVSQLMADQPSTPADRIRFWVDYVVRHGGATHFHPASARRLNWFQYWCLDVGLSLMIAAVLLVFIGCRLLRLTVSVVGFGLMKAFGADSDCTVQ